VIDNKLDLVKIIESR